MSGFAWWTLTPGPSIPTTAANAAAISGSERCSAARASTAPDGGSTAIASASSEPSSASTHPSATGSSRWTISLSTETVSAPSSAGTRCTSASCGVSAPTGSGASTPSSAVPIKASRSLAWRLPNSRNSKVRATCSGSNPSQARSAGVTSTGASTRSVISSTLRRTSSLCAAKFSASFGVWSAAAASSASVLPYLLSSLAAVFSPTPGTPGKLSEGSPRSAAYCT